LPVAGESANVGTRLEPVNHYLGEVELWRSSQRIRGSCPNEPVEVRFLNGIAVVENVVLKTDVCELLHDGRSAPAQPGNGDRGAGNKLFGFRAKK
jgi:hypothetical protein